MHETALTSALGRRPLRRSRGSLRLGGLGWRGLPRCRLLLRGRLRQVVDRLRLSVTPWTVRHLLLMSCHWRPLALVNLVGSLPVSSSEFFRVGYLLVRFLVAWIKRRSFCLKEYYILIWQIQF
jgi:hypothetical protein